MRLCTRRALVCLARLAGRWLIEALCEWAAAAAAAATDSGARRSLQLRWKAVWRGLDRIGKRLDSLAASIPLGAAAACSLAARCWRKGERGGGRTKAVLSWAE